MNLLITIIIPTYNRAYLINETLNSVLYQTYKNWECIIIDDESTDNTSDIVEKWVLKDFRFKYYIRPPGSLKGANACRNYGIEKSKGDYVVFLDSDDLLKEDCLEQRINAFNKYPEFDMLVFSMGHFTNIDNCFIDETRRIFEGSNTDTILEFVFGRKLPWNITRPIYKKQSVFNTNLRFNENIQNFQDDEFHINLLYKLKPKYKIIDLTDCFYRVDVKSLNKYETPTGQQNIINSLFDYYSSVFNTFSETQKKDLKKKTILKLFNQIRFHLLPKSNTEILTKTLVLFNKELRLTFREIIILKMISSLNLYYYNKRGYYKITKFLLKSI